MIQLENDIKTFTNVLHVGDIHIRLTQRHQEYVEAFDKLYKAVDETPISTLILVAGDIFHSKSDLSPEAVNLAADFLKNLADRRPTILIAGNHDATLTNKNRMDSLSPVVQALNHSNLYYLKDTEIYLIGNVLFNNYSVFSEPETYIHFNKIPNIYKNKVDYTIALYHGPVNNALTDMGYSVVNKHVTVSTFDGHQMVMLGDIHKHQVLQEYDHQNDKPIIAFCGSLVQQDHGENLLGHGYLYWDLKNKSFKHFEISNDYGFFTVEVNKGTLTTDVKNIPKKAKLRIKCVETVPSEIKTILSDIKTKSDITDITYVRIEAPSNKTDIIDASEFNLSGINDVEYQNSLIKTYLEKKKIEVSDEVLSGIFALNKEFNVELKKKSPPKNIRWKPKKFEFDNMFSYGECNVVDFSKMNGVMGLFASNASGKSSVFSALSFCLFDKCERAHKAVNILNSQKMSFKCKFNFEIDGVDFFIERNAVADKKGNVKVDVKFWKTVDGKDVDLNGEKRANTNDVIRDYIGSYDDFILTVLSVQNNKAVGFVDMGHTDRKDLLAQFIGLNVFDKLDELASKKANEIAVLLKNLNKEDYVTKIRNLEERIENYKQSISITTKESDAAAEKKEKLDATLLELVGKLVTINSSISDIKGLEKLKIDLTNSISTDENSVRQLKNQIVECGEKLSKAQLQIDELTNKNIIKNSESLKKLTSKYSTLEHEIRLKMSALKAKTEKLDKLNEHKYDPNCNFCVNNIFVKDAFNTKTEIEHDKNELKLLMDDFKSTKNDAENLAWVEKEMVNYQKLQNDKITIESNTSKLNNDILRIENVIGQNKNKLSKVEDSIIKFYQEKETIQNNNAINVEIGAVKLRIADIVLIYKTKNNDLMALNARMQSCITEKTTIETTVEKVKELEAKSENYKYYLQAINRNGIPYELISQTMPVIEKEVNDILHQIVDFTISFNADGENIYAYIVYEDKKWLVEMGSGMEKFISSLAIRVALTKISNIPRPNFVIFDEGWGTLDSHHISEVKLVFDFLKTQFDFIMIISHIDSIKDTVDKVLEINKNNGFSQIKYL